MVEKNNKQFSEKVKIDRNKIISDLFHSFTESNCDTWPELKTWDYKDKYGMDPIAFHELYGDYITKKSTYSSEKLFQFAAMRGATRDELARIMAYILALLDCEKYYLDMKKIKVDLGINELFKKYMVSRASIMSEQDHRK